MTEKGGKGGKRGKEREKKKKRGEGREREREKGRPTSSPLADVPQTILMCSVYRVDITWYI